jgi:hypothetical protein
MLVNLYKKSEALAMVMMSEIWGFHGGDDNKDVSSGLGALCTGWSKTTFWRSVLLPSSRMGDEQTHKPTNRKVLGSSQAQERDVISW